MKLKFLDLVKQAAFSGQLDTFEGRSLFCLQYFAKLCAQFPQSSFHLSSGFEEIQKDMDRARKVFQYQRIADNFCQAAA